MENKLLSYIDLCELINRGVITNVDKSKVNSSSIDVTLGKKILVEHKFLGGMKKISLKERTPLVMDSFTFGDSFIDLPVFDLMPGEFILANTEQEFNLPNNISAEYKLKSSLARIGLEHMNAGWCDAGWHGSVLTLEFKNMTNHHVIELRQGDPIGQVIFFKHAEVPAHASYKNRGRYNNDKEVKGIKL